MLNKETYKKIEEEIDAIKPEVIKTRRYIHQHPEIGFDTQDTEKIVRERLTSLGIEILPSKVGVIGIIKGARDTDIIALRADMDALCLQEENDVPYKSIYKNKMHACGHDAHTSMLLGAAEILQKNRALLPTDVLLLFQPAEEGPDLGGARIMLEDLKEIGIKDKIKFIFGQHVFNDYPCGTALYKYGSLMSSTDVFMIKIIGRGGHAGQPEKTIDALSVGAKFVNAIESFMSRRKDPFEPAVFSIGTFNAGSASNIVAETASLTGTIRCQSQKTRELILEKMDVVLKGVCEAFDAEYNLEILHGLPVLICNDDASDFVKMTLEEVFGKENTSQLQNPVMGAEDFAFFSEEIPCSFIFLGSGNKEKGFTHLGHNPKFDIDEDCMVLGIKTWCNLAFNM